jgi:hypothetical protein
MPCYKRTTVCTPCILPLVCVVMTFGRYSYKMFCFTVEEVTEIVQWLKPLRSLLLEFTGFINHLLLHSYSEMTPTNSRGA